MHAKADIGQVLRVDLMSAPQIRRRSHSAFDARDSKRGGTGPGGRSPIQQQVGAKERLGRRFKIAIGKI